jgi:HK97 gp10 family phage protein
MAFRLKWYGDRVAAKVVTSAARRTRAMAEELAGLVRDEAPVRTGALRASVGVESEQGGLVNRVTVNTDYAYFVHAGTRNSRSNPFFSRAIDRFRSKRR